MKASPAAVIQFVTPGLLGWAVAMSAAFGSAATLQGWRQSKLLRRLQLAPVGTGTIVGARVAVTLLISLGQLAIFLGLEAVTDEGLNAVNKHNTMANNARALAILREMGVGFRATSGPVIAKSGDLAAIARMWARPRAQFLGLVGRIHPNFVAARAAEQPIDRQVGGLPGDIPQSVLDSADRRAVPVQVTAVRPDQRADGVQPVLGGLQPAGGRPPR